MMIQSTLLALVAYISWVPWRPVDFEDMTKNMAVGVEMYIFDEDDEHVVFH